MTTKSMTGFARSDGSGHGLVWYWEVRSVNGRGLDVRVRVPPGYEQLDQFARKEVSQVLVRGNVNLQLNVQRETGQQEIRLNEDALEQVLAAARRVAELTGTEGVTAEAVLQIKGVLETTEPDEDPATVEARQQLLAESLRSALSDVVEMRANEGAKLSDAVAIALAEIERQVDAIKNAPSRQPDEIAKRIALQVDRLTDTETSLDPQRLHQEAVLLAAKADVEEEIQRLRAHITAAHELIEADGAVGRKLDFLTQEFNREANTICSKSNDIAITQAGLAMKAAIEQMREQVQNIE